MEIIEDERTFMCSNEESVDHIVEPCDTADLDDWFDIVYPEGVSDAVTVTKYDYSLLSPEEFISDNIVDFYIKHLQMQLPDDKKEKLYFFNSFFFRKLSEPDKLGSEKSFFERVKRWTARVDIFDKDFLFIPIMQNAHWSLIIVRNMGLPSMDEKDQCDTNVSVIYHLDSIEGYHMDLEDPVRTYLVEAWNKKHDSHDGHETSLRVEYLPAKVPQQTNLSDCGLFLLHYVEMFINSVWEQNNLDFMTSEWFDPADASRKRLEIQSLIQSLQEKEAAKRGLVSNVNRFPSSDFGIENSDVITNTSYSDYDKGDILQQSYFLHNQNYNHTHYNLLPENINFFESEYHMPIQQNFGNEDGTYGSLQFQVEKPDQSLLEEEAVEGLYRSLEYESFGNNSLNVTAPAISENVPNECGGMRSLLAFCVDYTSILNEDHHENNSDYIAVDGLTERNAAVKIERKPRTFSNLLEQCMHGNFMNSKQIDMVLMDSEKMLDANKKCAESCPLETVSSNQFNNDIVGQLDCSHLQDTSNEETGLRSIEVDRFECQTDFGVGCQTSKGEDMYNDIVVDTDLREHDKCYGMEDTTETVERNEDEMPNNNIVGHLDSSHLQDTTNEETGLSSSEVDRFECQTNFGVGCQTSKGEDMCNDIVVDTDLRETDKCYGMEDTTETVQKNEDEMPHTSRTRDHKRSTKKYHHTFTWLPRLTRSGTKIKGNLTSRRSYLLRRVPKK